MNKMNDGFRFKSDRLNAWVESLATGYASADPFPHFVIDGLLPESVLDHVLAEFPDADDERWLRRSTNNARFVVFSTTDTSFHGHPNPLKCPPGISRKSIAVYYYSNGRPKEEKTEPHSTIYMLRPGLNRPTGRVQELLRSLSKAIRGFRHSA